MTDQQNKHIRKDPALLRNDPDLANNLAWQLAKDGEEIPIAALMIASRLRKPTAQEAEEMGGILLTE